MVFVNLGSIQAGGLADNVGIFTGQNIQNSWDSHTPTTMSFGFVMGDFCRASSQVAWLSNHSVQGQPIYDNDYKGNQSAMRML